MIMYIKKCRLIVVGQKANSEVFRSIVNHVLVLEQFFLVVLNSEDLV